MTVYGRGAVRDRHGYFLGLTGPQAFLVAAAGFPVWLAMATGQWLLVLALVPTWALVALLVCLTIRGWSAAQWIGVLLRHLVGGAPCPEEHEGRDRLLRVFGESRRRARNRHVCHRDVLQHGRSPRGR